MTGLRNQLRFIVWEKKQCTLTVYSRTEPMQFPVNVRRNQIQIFLPLSNIWLNNPPLYHYTKANVKRDSTSNSAGHFSTLWDSKPSEIDVISIPILQGFSDTFLSQHCWILLFCLSINMYEKFYNSQCYSLSYISVILDDNSSLFRTFSQISHF